MNMKVLFRHFK